MHGCSKSYSTRYDELTTSIEDQRIIQEDHERENLNSHSGAIYSVGRQAGFIPGRIVTSSTRSMSPLYTPPANAVEMLIADDDIDRIEAGTFQYRRRLIDVDEIISRAIENTQNVAAQADVRLCPISSSPGLQISVTATAPCKRHPDW
jgi:hypothetical protein